MSTNIIEFAREGSGVRVIEIDEEPWFVAADVCNYFGVTNRNRALQRLEDDEKGGTQLSTRGGMQNVTIINESGLYSLLFALQPQKARGVTQEQVEERTRQIESFRRWVTSEVLPTIRKTGAYGVPQLTGPELVAAYVAACEGNIGHTAGAHVPWDEVDPYYQNQFRRQARAVIDHVMPHPDLFSQEGQS